MLVQLREHCHALCTLNGRTSQPSCFLPRVARTTAHPLAAANCPLHKRPPPPGGQGGGGVVLPASFSNGWCQPSPCLPQNLPHPGALTWEGKVMWSQWYPIQGTPI